MSIYCLFLFTPTNFFIVLGCNEPLRCQRQKTHTYLPKISAHSVHVFKLLLDLASWFLTFVSLQFLIFHIAQCPSLQKKMMKSIMFLPEGIVQLIQIQVRCKIDHNMSYMTCSWFLKAPGFTHNKWNNKKQKQLDMFHGLWIRWDLYLVKLV